MHYVGQRHRHQVWRPARHHDPELSPPRQLEGPSSEPRRQDSVEARGRATTLEVPKDYRACFLAGEAFELGGDSCTDPTQPLRASSDTGGQDRLLAAPRHRSFGHHHDARPSAQSLPGNDRICCLPEIERQLRDQDDVGPARDPGIQGDPPRVPPHHLNHHNARV